VARYELAVNTAAIIDAVSYFAASACQVASLRPVSR
jgi:hypothetical protein